MEEVLAHRPEPAWAIIKYMKGFKPLFLCLFACAFILLMPQTAHADTKEVYILDYQFNPQVVIISPGDTIKWTNKDTVAHSATSDTQTGSGAWDSGLLETDKSYSKTFATPGTYAYHCTPHPNMQAIIQVGTTVTIPTPVNSSVDVEPPASEQTSQSTTLSLTVFFDSIGQAGDGVTKNSAGNLSPRRTQRTVSYTLTDTTSNTMMTGETQVTYSAASGNFIGTALVDGLTSGNYLIKIRTDGFIENSPVQQSVTAGQTATIPPIYLVTGDINNDNKLNALDYNVLITCFGINMTSPACMDSQATDINDDGAVNGIDYNVFLRELSAISRI
jgi:plastocyanin